MGNGRKSGLPKGVRRIMPLPKERIVALSKRSVATGYKLNPQGIRNNAQVNALDTYIYTLEQYQAAMGESADIISMAGGSLSLYKFNSSVAGDADTDGNIRISSSRLIEISVLRDTLPHEHTHQLVNALVVKELGYAKGSPEYNSACRNADMYRIINAEALVKWKDYMKTVRGQNVDHITTTYEAAKLSGMRSYATKDYSWAPKGSGIEIPTVAAEKFVDVGYSWSELRRQSPYAYFVLQEIKNRINK